jgi:hypothetical protein
MPSYMFLYSNMLSIRLQTMIFASLKTDFESRPRKLGIDDTESIGTNYKEGFFWGVGVYRCLFDGEV